VRYTPVDFVADQLKAAAPSAEWDAAGVDRAHELAGFLVNRAGVRDLTKLVLYRVGSFDGYTVDESGTMTVVSSTPAYALSYNGGKTFGFLGEQDRAANDETLQYTDGKHLVAWSAEGHGNVSYLIAAVPGGFAIIPAWASSSDAGFYRDAFRFFLTAAVMVFCPIAGVQAGTAIGTAIVGETLAASYPGLAAAVGNASLSAAMTGGDIEDVAKGAVVGYFGGVAGDAVGAAVTGATDIDTLGKVADAATTAFIRGGDVEKAVAVSLLQSGASLSSSSTGAKMDDFGINDNTIPESFMPIPDIQLDETFPGDTLPTGSLPTDLPPIEYTAPAVAIEPPSVVMPSSPETTFDFRQIVGDVSYAALAALNVVAAYQRVNQPAVNTVARSTSANGVTTAATDSGYVESRDSSGRITKRKPAVGQPQSTITGNIIVNNGDGTYSLIYQDGTRRVIAYPAESVATIGGLSEMFSDIPPTVLIAGAVGLIAIFRKK